MDTHGYIFNLLLLPTNPGEFQRLHMYPLVWKAAFAQRANENDWQQLSVKSVSNPSTRPVSSPYCCHLKAWRTHPAASGYSESKQSCSSHCSSQRCMHSCTYETYACWFVPFSVNLLISKAQESLCSGLTIYKPEVRNALRRVERPRGNQVNVQENGSFEWILFIRAAKSSQVITFVTCPVVWLCRGAMWEHTHPYCTPPVHKSPSVQTNKALMVSKYCLALCQAHSSFW